MNVENSKRKLICVESDGWSCGDGCCSDSWINIFLMEDGRVVSRCENLRQWGYKEDFEGEIREWCKEEFDLQEGDFEWDF
jgi:hypothetical protein